MSPVVFETNANLDWVYTVKNQLINNCERMLKVDFEPLALKKRIDYLIDEANRDHAGNKWYMVRENADCRVWISEKGLPIAPDIPML